MRKIIYCLLLKVVREMFDFIEEIRCVIYLLVEIIYEIVILFLVLIINIIQLWCEIGQVNSVEFNDYYL